MDDFPLDERPPLPETVAASPDAVSLPAAVPPKTLQFPKRPQGSKRRTKTDMPDTLSRQVGAQERASLAALEVELGGRQKLAAYLAQAQLDREGYRLLGLLSDPAYEEHALAEICAVGNIPIARVMVLVTAALEARAQLLSKMHIADKLPDVTRHVMEDALPGDRTCRTCNGLGTSVVETTVDGKPVTESKTCKTCNGKGTVEYVPDLGVRKTALTLGGLLKNGSPVGNQTLIAKQMNLVTPGAVNAFEQIIAATDKLLYRGPTVDGEVTE